ncbi:MAG: hypothetical protein HUU14_03930 [Dehalococcoidia bacterium]|nr:MAG: hypothetical protein EDM76_08270 [bacterium]MCK6565391.1 hypothetical protein [Dehalococcoidia bacterium]MCL4232840.1 hypothetical protein [Dehalococcoidia bacterium]NUQ55018.1 hypothetical protein [Dehalococcoidia bacterium]
MLLRARTRSEARPRFEEWFHSVHLRDVGRIPGITSIQSGTTAAGTKLGFYSFSGAEVIQAALSSPEASYARGTWEAWSKDLEELSIEIFAPLSPLLVYRTPC